MSSVTTKNLARLVPTTMAITTFIHCSKCLDYVPKGMSPAEWADISVGLTTWGLQVWCRRHRCNVVHIDFLGQRCPANTATRLG